MKHRSLSVLMLVLVSLIIAVLLATALTSFTRVSDSALAQMSPSPLGERQSQTGGKGGRGEVSSRPSVAGKNYLPIIFLNSATAGGAWLLGGNAGTNWLTDFLGTTDNMTLTIRVSNTVAYRIVPAVEPFYGFSPNIIGGSASNAVLPGAIGATIAGGGMTGHGNIIGGFGTFTFIGGGMGNIANGNFVSLGGGYFNTASGSVATIAGGDQNTASGVEATIGGGTGNTASGTLATIAGGVQNIASGRFATIGGGDQNTASGVFYATVAGGTSNNASGTDASIVGGFGNTASGDLATIGGGRFNTAKGPGSFVGGGGYDGTNHGGNQAIGNASTIGGGISNTVPLTGSYSFIGGGFANTANGLFATIPGGNQNIASGDYSFAAGRYAQAFHQGAFVWADSSGIPISSTTPNQFLVRASGGITMYTDAVAGMGVEAAPGSGSWSTVSNKNLKTNFSDVDSRAILERVSDLPITTWNYKTQDESIRHIGPMAQDFYTAFNVGENDTTISTVDAQGVALAAIQGLAQENKELKARVSALEGGQTQNALSLNILTPWAVVALLAVMLVRRP